jgi:thiol-disulfide isomerase/thioredoxin
VAAEVDSKEVKSTTDSEKESFWTGGRIAITLIIGGLFIWWGVSRWTASRVPNVARPASVTTRNAPPGLPPTTAAFVPLPAQLRDTTLQTLDGKSLKLSDFSDKVVVVNIWATWCGPCRMEMPELVKMSNEYKARGLVVLGLATTYNEQRGGEEGVKEYIKQNNVPYQIIWDDGTLAGPLVEAVQGRSVIPQSFVISRDGNIVKHFTGFNVYQTPQQMREAIEAALGDKGKA